MEQSPSIRMRQLELRFNAVFAGVDVPSLDKPEQKLVLEIRRDVMDVKLDIRDYEYAETAKEQQIHSLTAKKRLERLNKSLLTASEYNLFTSIDVAELSANIEQIISDIS